MSRGVLSSKDGYEIYYLIYFSGLNLTVISYKLYI